MIRTFDEISSGDIVLVLKKWDEGSTLKDICTGVVEKIKNNGDLTATYTVSYEGTYVEFTEFYDYSRHVESDCLIYTTIEELIDDNF